MSADPMSNDTYYTVLGVSQSASQSEIKAAYRRLLAKVHPDTVSTLSLELRRLAEGATKDITEAYSVLSDTSRRRQYDRELALEDHTLKPRPSSAPEATPCPTNTASTSGHTGVDSRRRKRIHLNVPRSPLKRVDRVIGILVALFILACIALIVTLFVKTRGTPPDSDDSKMFSKPWEIGNGRDSTD